MRLELEVVSTELAARREELRGLQGEREAYISEHRAASEALEAEMQGLRPAALHGVTSSRADSMTEGEVTAAVARTAEVIAAAAEVIREANEKVSSKRVEQLRLQTEAVDKQAYEGLRNHAKFELERLEAAGTEAAEAVAVLLDTARARADLAVYGVTAEDAYGVGAHVPTRRDVKRLRSTLLVAREAWEEAVSMWCGGALDGEGAAAPSLPVELGVDSVTVDRLLSSLEVARGRIAQVLLPLERADPGIYDLVVGGGDPDSLDDEDAAGERAAAVEQLPHGWEAHVAPSGHVYYHSLVTRETQWETPGQDAAVAAGWRLLQAENGDWFYHNPYDGSGVWWPELPPGAANPSTLEALRLDVAQQ